MSLITMGEELWNLHVGLSSNGLSQLVDLDKIPRKMREIERKYLISSSNGSVDAAISSLFARIGKFVEENNLTVASMYTFVGIDQYYIFKKNRREYHFRYRSGAN